MSKRQLIVFAVFVWGLGLSFPAPGHCLDLDESALPENWTLQKTIAATPDEISEWSTNLGMEIVDLKSYLILAGDVPLQIKVVDCDDKDKARVICFHLLTMRGGKEIFVRQYGKSVVEFTCDCSDEELIRQAHKLFPSDPPEEKTEKRKTGMFRKNNPSMN